MKLGIVPAGGSAYRFGGVSKELLPMPSGKTLLQNAIDALSFCDDIVILTTPEKAPLHSRVHPHLVCRNTPTLWDALNYVCTLDADQHYFIMPDTVVSGNAFGDGDLCFGVFTTTEPKRFGIFVGNEIIDKSELFTGEQMAWGTITWSKKVTEFWRAGKWIDHTAALNAAIKEFGHTVVELESYYDFATIEDYLNWIRSKK